jgi:hypothetical protein
MSVFEDGRKPRKEIFDRRSHLGHTHNVDNRLQGSEDRPKNLRILLTEVLV